MQNKINCHVKQQTLNEDPVCRLYFTTRISNTMRGDNPFRYVTVAYKAENAHCQELQNLCSSIFKNSYDRSYASNTSVNIVTKISSLTWYATIVLKYFVNSIYKNTATT